MEQLIAVAILWVVAIGVLAGRPLYIKARERMSPKYAAARKVRLAQKSAREDAARKQARIDESARLKDWATEHPDDETAQAYLATLPTDTTTVNAAVEDIEAVLRERQAQEDATEARRREYRRKEAEYLAWALENPMNAVARRYLGAALVEADRNSKYGPNQAEAAEAVEAIKAALALAGTPA